MIRFVPDSFYEALMRPIAMAAPDGGVYIEIIAPDFRPAFILALLVVWVLLPRRQSLGAPLVSLLVLSVLAFGVWLASSGNGRYFLPFLVLAGPLAVALLHRLPATRAFKLAAAAGMLGWQVFLLSSALPWQNWGHVHWGEGHGFHVEVPEDVRHQPATYVTLSSISYSLIAPHFHPDSRWINISSLGGEQDNSRAAKRVRDVLAGADQLRAIFPTLPGGDRGDRLSEPLALAVNDLLSLRHLSLRSPAECIFLPSRGLQAKGQHRSSVGEDSAARHGFWLCEVTKESRSSGTLQQMVPGWMKEVFDKVERACPRMFPPGSVSALRIPSGSFRGYPDSDMKLYVLDDGTVMYKYLRALNPVILGKASDVLAEGFRMDCRNIRGRSGLPWDREI